MRLALLFRMLPRFVRLISSRTNGGMLSALTSRIGNLALHQNASYRVALGETDRTHTPVLMASLGFEGHLFAGASTAASHFEMIEFPVEGQDAPAGPWGELNAELFERSTDAIFPKLWVDLQPFHFLHGPQSDFGRWLTRLSRLIFQPGKLFLDPPLERRMDCLSRGAQIACNRGGGPSLCMEFNDGQPSLSWIGHLGKQRETRCCSLWRGAIGQHQLDSLSTRATTKLDVTNGGNFMDVEIGILSV